MPDRKLIQEQRALAAISHLADNSPLSKQLNQSSPRLKVVISGGGPVGLMLAISLQNVFKGNIDISIYEARWKSLNGRISWKSKEEGNERRKQVVTIQSRPFSLLPEDLQRTLLEAGICSEIWPYSEDSPKEIGRPKSFHIEDLEDHLLHYAQQKNIKLIPTVFDMDRWTAADDILAICEGKHAATRESLRDKFGAGDPAPYSINGEPVIDTVLGLQVKSRIKSAAAVFLTIIQNRYLLNVDQEGLGYLNIRLTAAEAQQWKNRNALIPTELLRHVQQGLKLFDILPADMRSIHSFNLSMIHRNRFSAQLSQPETSKSQFAFLLGDAANALHFWPGRGLSQGILSALSLAHCLGERWSPHKAFRAADFSKHEGIMHMLQHRHKTRAWYAMTRSKDNRLYPIHALIANSHLTQQKNKVALIDCLMERCFHLRKNLAGRLAEKCALTSLYRKLRMLEVETLQILVGGGQWETHLSGGPEIRLDDFYALQPPFIQFRPSFLAPHTCG